MENLIFCAVWMCKCKLIVQQKVFPCIFNHYCHLFLVTIYFSIISKVTLEDYISRSSLNNISLTLSWRRPMSYRNQSIDLRNTYMDWFLYDIGLRHERVKEEWWIHDWQKEFERKDLALHFHFLLENSWRLFAQKKLIGPPQAPLSNTDKGARLQILLLILSKIKWIN